MATTIIRKSGVNYSAVEELLYKVGGNESALWNLLTVLRGPDDGNDELKRLTTARIRGFLGFRSPIYIYKTDKLTEEQRDRRDILLDQGSIHFSSHYSCATSVIRNFWRYDLYDERKVG